MREEWILKTCGTQVFDEDVFVREVERSLYDCTTEHPGGRERDLDRATDLLEQAREHGCDEDPRYLDLVQKALVFDRERPHRTDHEPSLMERLERLLASAPRADNFQTQFDRFCQREPSDVAHILRTLDPQCACSIMMRGGIRCAGLPRHIPMAVLRTRLLALDHDFSSLQRTFGRCRNAQLAEMYEELSVRELKDELSLRGVTAGRNARVSADSLKERLRRSDDAWVRGAKVDSLGGRCDQMSVVATSLMGAPSEVNAEDLNLLACDFCHRPSQRKRTLHEAERLCGNITAKNKKLLWMLADMHDVERGPWRLKTEALYSAFDDYEHAELQDLVRLLPVKAKRHAVKQDLLIALQLFRDRRTTLLQREQRKESTITAGQVAPFRKHPEMHRRLSELYASMSVEQLEEECVSRRLSQFRVENPGSSTLKRRPAAHDAPGGTAMQLRKRLRASDEMFQQECPDDGYADMDNKSLRKLVGAVGVSRGDGSNGAMVENLDKFFWRQHSIYWRSVRDSC